MSYLPPKNSLQNLIFDFFSKLAFLTLVYKNPQLVSLYWIKLFLETRLETIFFISLLNLALFPLLYKSTKHAFRPCIYKRPKLALVFNFYKQNKLTCYPNFNKSYQNTLREYIFINNYVSLDCDIFIYS